MRGAVDHDHLIGAIRSNGRCDIGDIVTRNVERAGMFDSFGTNIVPQDRAVLPIQDYNLLSTDPGSDRDDHIKRSDAIHLGQRYFIGSSTNGRAPYCGPSLAIDAIDG